MINMSNISKVQKEINVRISKVIHILKNMADFEMRYIIKRVSMSILEKIIMIIKARSFGVKKIYVRENYKETDDIEERLKKGLNAKKILKYKKDLYSFRWVVWYI